MTDDVNAAPSLVPSRAMAWVAVVECDVRYVIDLKTA